MRPTSGKVAGMPTRGGRSPTRAERSSTRKARCRFHADEVASNVAMRRLARQKSLRKSAQSGLCDAKSDAAPESFFSHGSSRTHGWRCTCCTRRFAGLKAAAHHGCEKKSAFYRCFFSGACPSLASPTSAAGAATPFAVRDDATPPGWGRKKSCAKVLTPRKTVIRFRPKQRLLRMRVSRINTTARETTQPIVRTRIAVDAGLASPEKTQRSLFIAPASPGDAGVFVFVGARVSHARTPEESASPRVSRRRLPTGPTPAAFLAAGPASGQMCCNQT